MATKKTTRVQLAKVTDSIISPARIRSYIDTNGINRAVEESLEKVKLQLTAIRKEGGPKCPEPVPSLKKDASETEKTEHARAKDKYVTELKKYNEFTSERYTNLEKVYLLSKLLMKVHALLLKVDRKPKQNVALDELYRVINDEAPAQRKNETNDNYKKRVEDFEPHGFKDLVKGVNLKNPEVIQKLLSELKGKNSDLALFLRKGEISRSRIRFNDPAAVAIATAMELGIEELIESGLKYAAENDLKTLQPDHCFNDEFPKNEWYMLFKNLPHVQALLERQQRRDDYFVRREEAKRKRAALLKSNVRKGIKVDKKKKKVEPVSFNETEAQEGYAWRVEKEDKKGNKKYKYYWKGIDKDDENDAGENSFQFYVSQVCKNVLMHMVDNGDEECTEIKISTSVRNFFADLIVDFIARFAPQARILINAMDLKTVDHKVVNVILRMMVTDDYHSSDGLVTFNDEHQRLFDLIEHRIELCVQHQTGRVTKSSAESKENGHTVNEEESSDESEEEMPEPVKKSAGPAMARKITSRA